MMGRRTRWLLPLGTAALLAATSSQGCSCGGEEGQEPTGTGGTGVGGAGAQGGGGGLFGTGPGGGPPTTVDCDVPCEQGNVCSHGTCVPLTECVNDNECANDTTCVLGTGCVPWEGMDPASDPQCINVITPGIFAPKVKCEFSAAPAGDPFPGHLDVQGTPIVVNFNVPATAGPPSIAASFTVTVQGSFTEDQGVIRVLRGDSCALEANLGGTDLDNDGVVDWVVSSASLAAGDLDGDGSAEIVAYGADGSTMAFTRKMGVWSLLWKAPHPLGAVWNPCTANNHRCSRGWAGPAIHDLNDDGVPEVLRESAVFSATGQFMAASPPGYTSYSQGLLSVTANLDEDAAIETTNGARIWEWTDANGWVPEAYFPGTSTVGPGHVAVADFGDFGGDTVPPEAPELAVVRSSMVTVFARDGVHAQPPTAVPGQGGGGPPTISDFDGDGLPEVAVAGEEFYTIYDIDCGPTPRPNGMCSQSICEFAAGGVCPPNGYIAWSRRTQDISSNVTGSSVFDFEADGVSEVVYGDECFTRVYNGQTGDVLFSQYRSSCTWYENPIIADVDGNFRADLVVPSNKACSPNSDGRPCVGLEANNVDPQFPGLRCQAGTDCVSGVCDSGFCRCTSEAQCCGAMDDAACIDEGHRCAAPPAGTPGAGNTCRAAHPRGAAGIRVYSDANDRWVRSRTIWNQHAYAVTHVNEDGTIPRSSEWDQNWTVPGLNNFRQNVPGTPNGTATGDVTAGASNDASCTGSAASLQAPICNRGADSIGAGLSVGFYVEGVKVCGTVTTMPLAPGACETVTCTWDEPPTQINDAVEVTVTPNDDHAYAECKEGNNDGVIQSVFCTPPQ
ncbi:CARDB domain-containing protein [Chondromyces apiculatus]|uniref:CARDB domain-containing protein n=1 Tax=Chondromyces apiculatus DSM 436 TaxID=1192034 RepID=A0A017T058_9BACT|nr:CARDB domain-containing protein [Chondromyces apiculatus]EYF02578.1 Hypothetical protein CAP_6785 [Chondromyces apiculatus DSM 436]